MRYAIWNNKGGVGKTFLSFALATEWAAKNPDARVLVVDMCPQANVSEILLGGNGTGHENLMNVIDQEKTIGGYFRERIESPHRPTNTEKDYALLVNRGDGANIPSNLYLVAGDPALELQVQTINNIAVQELPPDSWKNVHSWVKDLIDGIIKTFEGRETLCIIDCNPSFASYTEQALLAAERLIVPCSPDGSSARAINNLARLVYGVNTPEIYQSVGFHHRAKQFEMDIPKLHMVLLNRSTTYDKKPSKAFQAMANQIESNVENFMKKLPATAYVDSKSAVSHMPDAHTAAVVATSLGQPFFQLSAKPYELRNGEEVQLNNEQLNPYKEKLAGIVASL